ncbi:MAG: carboxylating nicotinate-nucleotide diphosphorylase [Lachnospiraceae bacterium]|nr:carboxylating nicotinate-nucleotide diphosphorylase [Lachnospiraceae bacterium]
MNNITMKMNVDELILGALREDISSEDVSTNAVMKTAVPGQAELICKEDGVLCGLEVFRRVFELFDDGTTIEVLSAGDGSLRKNVFADPAEAAKKDRPFLDGDSIRKGEEIALVKGDIRTILSGERTALNYLQRMSGIATYTRKCVEKLSGDGITLLDTRKTSPNNRIFEKYAVRVGGGQNHRYNLSDGVLLKDNHIGAAGGVKEAIAAAKAYAPFVRKIEIETESLDMVKDALAAGADIIMLDNMSVEDMKEAVKLIDHRAEVELSGNFTLENMEKARGIGADFVSCGALTHSAPVLDYSLKNLKRLA